MKVAWYVQVLSEPCSIETRLFQDTTPHINEVYHGLRGEASASPGVQDTENC
jgi:hypothetical protein